MTGKTRALLGVVTMTALLLLYFVLAGGRALALFGTGDPVGIAIGVALLVLPLVGLWALWRELQFGGRAAKLTQRLSDEGRMPEEAVDTSPSGKPDRAQADEVFPKYRAEAEAAPDAWQSWLRLGIVYDACGDRKRARAAVNRAIALSRGESVRP